MSSPKKPKQTAGNVPTRGATKKPLIGAVKPRIHTPFLKGESRLPEVVKFLDTINIKLLPWQACIMEDMLRVNKEGKFIRRTNLAISPRQNGKTTLAKAMILAHMFVFDSKNIIGLSSNRSMAFDVFRAVANTIEENDVLLHKTKAIRYTNGQESITLTDNTRYEIVAATRDGSRGKSCDFLFIDELREVSVEGFQAAVPTTRARANAMSLYCSNAGDAFSTVLNDLRTKAMEYPSPSFGFYEYSAPPSIRQNLHDRKLWAISNPALGHTITEEAIEESIATNSIETTLTETFSVWIDSQVSPWTFGSIEACSKSDLILPVGANTVFAFDVSPSKRTGSLVAAQIVDGKIGVGIMETFTSDIAIDELKMTQAIHDWALKYRPSQIAFDRYATASIAQKLEQQGHKLIDISGQNFYQACGELADSLTNFRLLHSGQPEWVSSMNNCAAKYNDSGFRIIRRKSAGDVTAAIATAMCVNMLSKPISVPMIYV
jgi:phage terminase large subunit-like protein